jgi:hypothetical protein
MTFGSTAEIADFMSDARLSKNTDEIVSQSVVYDNTPDDFYFPDFH